MMNLATFAAAGTVFVQVGGPGTPQSFALPVPDGGNLDFVVANTGALPAWLAFPGGSPVGANIPGCLVIPGNAQVLLTAYAVTLATMNANPLVQGGPRSVAAQTATTVSATTAGGQTSLTFTRGTATSRPAWSA